MIRIYGEIGFEVMPGDVIAQLEEHSGDTIDVHINSVGGDVFDGLSIYNALSQWRGKVNVYIDGLAASMASVIAMAGDTVSMASASLLMIHNPKTWVGGDQHKMKQTADLLETVRQILVGAYSRKTGMEPAAIIEMLDTETWMDAETAKRLGFVDEVIDSDLDMAACLRSFDLTKFKNVPEVAMSKETPAAESATQKEATVVAETPAAPAAKPKEPEMGAQNIAAQVDAAKAAAIADERNRVSEINRICAAAKVTDLAADLIEAGATVDQARAKVLDALVQRDVSHTPAATTVEDNRDKRINAATEWFLHRIGHADGGKRIQVAGDNPFRGMKLLDFARVSLERAGERVTGMSGMELAIRAATHSTSDFPVALENVMHKTLLGAFSTAGDTWRAFCATGDLSDFRPHNRYLQGSFSDLQTVNENGEFQDGTLDDTRKEQITLTTKGRILNLSRQMIVNDDMGVFTNAARSMGRAAARTLEGDVYALLAQGSDFGPTMSDSTTLFHSGHGNVTTGAPSAEAFAAAINVLRSQKLPNASSGADEFIDLQLPPVFVGPLGLAQDAKVINESQYDPDTANKLQKPNKSRGLIGAIVGTPRRTGTPWFLFADPNEVPVIEVGFLDGNQAPVLEIQDGFRVDGVSWKVRFDYGIAAVNWLGAVRSTGA